LFYTQEEVRELIEYARDRGIRVVPEFDLPGHSTAWFVGYPELASGPGPYEIERRWGVFDPAVDPTNEKNYKFLNEFVGEMAKLFPDQFFHVGGDEVNGKQWDANAAIQAFKQTHGIRDNAGLQAYFNKRLQGIVTKHDKTMIGWDEVLDPSLPRDITIQSWRGPESLAQAAKEGYRGLLSSGYYLDLGWSASRHYAVDPMDQSSAALSRDEKARILGGEACMWSEYVDAENIDSRIWPRNAAIAERLWSPAETRDPDFMYLRLEAISQQLEWLGLTHKTYYRQMLQRISGPASTAEFVALRNLADVVEPVKDYTRASTAVLEATSATPLNRLVDAVPLESDHGRNFEHLVDEYIQSKCKDATSEATLRTQLDSWRENDAKFRTLAQRSFLAKEAAATSQDLSGIAGTGLEAIDYLAKGLPAPPDWKKEKLAMVQNAEAPKAQLLLIPTQAISKMVEAAATGVCFSK
jgi:hexosaminidase